MRFITIKTRVTIYFTLMMVLVVALVLVFMLIVGQRVLTNNAEATLLDVVHDNIDDVEYKDGYLDLDELNLYRHNVYILVYDDAQQLIGGAGLRHFDGDDEFFNGETRDVVIDGENYLVYDLYVQNPGGNVWLRGITSTDNSFSAVRIIVILSLVLFPVLVLLTAVVGWLIARRAFLPVRQITDTVDASPTAPTSPPASASSAGATRYTASPPPSTGCSTGWSTPSTPKSASPPTPRTSCARPSPSSSPSANTRGRTPRPSRTIRSPWRSWSGSRARCPPS